MAKKIQFKNPDTVLVTAHMGKITNDNITQDKYDRLLELNPVHADLFEMREVEEVPLFIVPPKNAPEPEKKKSNKPQVNE
jgi:hypothetical protein